jgi:hypothetical protein
MTSKEHIDEIIKQTFIRLELAYKNHREGQIGESINHKKGESRLVFPCYNNKKREIRISEQELRFIFVETFNEYCDEKELDWYYSVETPTKDKYKFTEKGDNLDKPKREEGQSANFDLTISNDKGELLALIEFKAKNTKPFSYAKDLCKLWNPKEGTPNVLRYFINVLDKADKNTSDNIQAKLDNLRNNKEKYDANIHLIFKALECVECNNPIVEEVI